MATTNTTSKFYAYVDGKEVLVTEYIALQWCIKVLTEFGQDVPDGVKQKVHHMLVAKTPKAKPEGYKSEKDIENAAMAKELLACLKPGQVFDLAFVKSHVKFVSTSAKATKVVAKLIEAGVVSKVYKKSGNAEYRCTLEQ